MEVLRQQLVTGEEGIELVKFFESCASRHAMIVALLAVLELTRLQAIMLVQEKQFGEIRLRKHKMFDVVFSGGEGIDDTQRDSLREIDEQYSGGDSTSGPQRS
jgi:chromatin segregation and condensation protein Rec8/ScpA/Scc1 (kleisin family)